MWRNQPVYRSCLKTTARISLQMIDQRFVPEVFLIGILEPKNGGSSVNDCQKRPECKLVGER
jgi:hypothetical protein